MLIRIYMLIYDIVFIDIILIMINNIIKLTISHLKPTKPTLKNILFSLSFYSRPLLYSKFTTKKILNHPIIDKIISGQD